jgi:hypothetical protein
MLLLIRSAAALALFCSSALGGETHNAGSFEVCRNDGFSDRMNYEIHPFTDYLGILISPILTTSCVQTDVISRMRVKAESSTSIDDEWTARRSVETDTTGGVYIESSESCELQDSSMSMVMPSSVDDVTPLDEFTGESSESGQQDVPPIYEYYSYTARVTVSTDETIYAYTVSIADNDASITSRLSGAPEVDEEDATLYFTMDELTCDVNAQDPHSFMVGKFQAWEASSNPDVPQTVVGKRVCWAAPPGYIISQGIPTTHKLIIQLFHHIENDWEYDIAIPTDDGHAKVYKLKNDPYTELQVNEDGTYIYYKTRVF